ncbi:MAG: DUF268 domain-containing protein [bacterium]|nr:DUF268 domain-containing protein [bacterium]
MTIKSLISRFIVNSYRNGNLLFSLRKFPHFYSQFKKYKSQSGENVDLKFINPQLTDATRETPFDSHYFYQSAWCARKIAQQKPLRHKDIASQINLIGPLSAFVETEFIDYRPFNANLKNLELRKGTILNLPYDDKSVESLSCLHVIEHIGLGRYGDEIDSKGSIKACKELQRVIAVNGNLYLSTPLGKERVEFNAHRVHSSETILRLFDELTLVDFSSVNDKGNFKEKSDPSDCDNFQYGLGMFHFRRL